MLGFAVSPYFRTSREKRNLQESSEAQRSTPAQPNLRLYPAHLPNRSIVAALDLEKPNDTTTRWLH
jgi:hypothetical protein